MLTVEQLCANRFLEQQLKVALVHQLILPSWKNPHYFFMHTSRSVKHTGLSSHVEGEKTA